MSGNHVEELLEGYLLGALDAQESARVASHIGVCMTCAAQLVEMREVIATLAQSVEPLEPRASLKAQIMAAAAQEDDAVQTSALRSLGERRRRDVRPQLLALAAGVCAALAVGAVVWALVLQSRLDDRDADLAGSRLAAAAFARSAQVLHMEGEFAGSQIDAAIAVPGQGTSVTLVVTGLPELPDSEEYRLWLFENGEPLAGVPLTADSKGSVITQLALDLSKFDEMELDAQPVDADAPGGTLVLGGPLR